MSYSTASAVSSPVSPAPIVPATPRGEATRRKLLDAAEKEFGEKGYHAASVSSITTRAGVGQGTFYLYFHSKEEIFTTLVREIGHALRKHTALAIEAGGQTRMEAERAGLDAFLEFTKLHPGLYRIVQESQFVDEPVYREYYTRLASGYAKAIDEATVRGELAPGNSEVRAWAIMGIGHFLGLRYCLWQGKQPDVPTLDQVMAFIGDGMAPKPKK